MSALTGDRLHLQRVPADSAAEMTRRRRDAARTLGRKIPPGAKEIAQYRAEGKQTSGD